MGLCYTEEEVGATSRFGHLVDHMAMNRYTDVRAVRRFYLTNPMFGGSQNTATPITDHNAVKTTFRVQRSGRSGRSKFSGEKDNLCIAGILTFFGGRHLC